MINKSAIIRGQFHFTTEYNDLVVKVGLRATMWSDQDPLKATAIEFIQINQTEIKLGEMVDVVVRILSYKYFEDYLLDRENLYIGFGKYLLGVFYPIEIIQEGDR